MVMDHAPNSPLDMIFSPAHYLHGWMEPLCQTVDLAQVDSAEKSPRASRKIRAAHVPCRVVGAHQKLIDRTSNPWKHLPKASPAVPTGNVPTIPKSVQPGLFSLIYPTLWKDPLSRGPHVL